MLTVKTNYAIDPSSAKAMDTNALRQNFLMDGMFATNEIRLIYSHYDRMIVGGAVPENQTLVLDEVRECGTASVLDRREMGILNIGDPGTVSAGGHDYAVGKGDMLYLPMGTGAISFSGPGRFYIVSTPAHASHPARLLTLADAVSLKMGAPETANDRTIFQFIHPDVMPTCQLVMGYTMFHAGSVWNTMPAHLHDRRMEAYLYFDLEDSHRVFHIMGQPDETRHLVIQNEEGALSPPWSIHCGAGTGSYAFCWAMAGDNTDYRDVNMIQMEDLR